MSEQKAPNQFSQLDYMLAYLRLNTNSDMSTWSILQAVQSFAILPPPKISYANWVETIALLAGVEEEKEPEPVQETPKEMDPYERIIRYHPHLFNSGIVCLGEPEKEEKKTA